MPPGLLLFLANPIVGAVASLLGIAATVALGAPALMGSRKTPEVSNIELLLDPVVAESSLNVGDEADLVIKFCVAPGDCDDNTTLKVIVDTDSDSQQILLESIDAPKSFTLRFRLEGHKVGTQRIRVRVKAYGEKCSGLFFWPDDKVVVEQSEAKTYTVNEPYRATNVLSQLDLNHGGFGASTLTLTSLTTKQGYFKYANGDCWGMDSLKAPLALTVNDQQSTDLSCHYTHRSDHPCVTPEVNFQIQCWVTAWINAREFSIDNKEDYVQVIDLGPKSIGCHVLPCPKTTAAYIKKLEDEGEGGSEQQLAMLATQVSSLSDVVTLRSAPLQVAMEGQVTDRFGEPVKEPASITVSDAMGSEITAHSDDRGLFRLAGYVEGRHCRLTYRGHKFYGEVAERMDCSKLSDQYHRLVLSFKMTPRISGQVKDQDGQALPLSRVYVKDPNTGSLGLADITDEDGKFTIDPHRIIDNPGLRARLLVRPQEQILGQVFEEEAVELDVDLNTSERNIALSVTIRQQLESTKKTHRLSFVFEQQNSLGESVPVKGLEFVVNDLNDIRIATGNSDTSGKIVLTIPAGVRGTLRSPNARSFGLDIPPVKLRLVRNVDLGIVRPRVR